MADLVPIEFSQLTSGGNIQAGDIVVGLRGGLNRKFTFSSVLSVTGTANEITVTGSTAPIISIANNPVLPGNSGVTVPVGTTAQRAGSAGTLRFNSQTTELETTLDGSTWVTLTGSGGTVLSVSGTANRITSTGGINPVIDIAGTYVGQTSITTLGTIVTGTWNGVVIGPVYGGTGLNSYVLGDTLYGSAPNVLSKLSGNITVNKQFLSQTGDGVNSAAPVWATIAGTDITGAALTKTDDTNVTLTLGGTPTTALLRAASLTLGWTGQLSTARGGTGLGSFTSGEVFYASSSSVMSQIAYQSTGGTYGDTSNLVARNANGVFASTNCVEGLTSTAAGGTITLTAASNRIQIVTGAGATTLTLPDATTLIAGYTYFINNNSSGTITLKDNGANTLGTIPPASYIEIFCTSVATSNGTWDGHWELPASTAAGQLYIGNGATAGYTLANLTAGTGVSITNGAGSITISATSAASVVKQVVIATTNTSVTTSTSIPSDDTIPQNTEGAEAMTVTITPTSSSNNLIIMHNAIYGSNGDRITVALFKDSNADAINAVSSYTSLSNIALTVPIIHTMTAGTTSATTFKIRFGPAAGSTTRFLGSSASDLYLTSCIGQLIVYEVSP